MRVRPCALADPNAPGGLPATDTLIASDVFRGLEVLTPGPTS